MRRMFISADMEGCAAVSSPQALMPDRWSWEWASARRWLSAEVRAAAEAALEAKFDEVIVADGHGNAHNIDPDTLPRNVRLVRSWPRPLLQMQGVECPGVEVCAFVGYHALPSGNKGGILAHTYSGASFREIRVNGEPCSEGYLNAALAGEFDRPVIFVSGDQQTIDDARRYAPSAVVCVTKESFGWRSQMSLHPTQICEAIKKGVATALEAPRPDPFGIRGPLCLEIEMTSQVAAETLAYLPGVLRTGAYGIGATFETMVSLMRFIAFAMLYSPTGATPL